jgi:diadenosine tetraphosphate (Ap4A) HIT family hydrolase
MSRSSCCFCNELAGGRTEFHDLYPALESRLLVEAPNFVVMPSLGQLAPGHTLLVPTQHVTSFGELDAARRREARALYFRWRRTLSQRFSSVVCFEHGSPPSAPSGGCGIVHAHLHVVPLGRCDARLPASVGGGWRETDSRVWLDEAAEVSRRGSGYLMWHGPGEIAHIETAEEVPSQHLRRHVAEVLGEVRWDWRTAGHQRELVALLADSLRDTLGSAAAVG